jgi:CHAD domain-containing protein
MQQVPESIKSVIIAYLNKYLDIFRINLEKAMDVYDPEAIHEYRVAVKRIRAIMQAVNRIYDDPVFEDNLILPLRLMFKAGGTIRDDQVQIGLVEVLEIENGLSFPLIKDFYKKKIEDQRTSFFLKSVDFDYHSIGEIAAEIEGAIDRLDEVYLELHLYQRLYKSMQKLKRRRYDLENPEMLHSFRTRFKENGYVAEMLYHSQYSYKVSKVVYNRMKNFGQELGNWHDHYQLWSKTAIIFQESRNNELLKESFELRKFIMPVHDKLFQEILHMIKRDDSLFVV